MQDFFSFVIAHWYLWLLFVVLLGFLIQLEMSHQVSGITMLTPQQTVNLINKEGAAVFDVRDSAAYDKGHILNAVRIELDDITSDARQIKRFKAKPVIVTCQNGQQSPRIAGTLSKHQFKNVFALRGGINAWQAENFPLTEERSE